MSDDIEHFPVRGLMQEWTGLPPKVDLDTGSVLDVFDRIEDVSMRLSSLACDGTLPGAEPAVAARYEAITAIGELELLRFRIEKAALAREAARSGIRFVPPPDDCTS